MDQRQTNTRHRVEGPTDVGLAGWGAAAKQTWEEAARDNLGLLAAGIAFNLFLAMVPLLTAVVLAYGLVASPAQVADHIAALARNLPPDATNLIAGQLESMVENAGTAAGFGLLASLAIAVYGALRGATGVITGLNVAYNVAEARPFARRMLVALAITGGAIAVLILASLGVSVLSLLETFLPARGALVPLLLQVAFWLFAAAAIGLILAAIYAWAPNRDNYAWRWVTPGSAFATLVWILATGAFSLYVSNFGNYNATYGALGAVVVFLTWLYLSAYILLLGAELNQVLARRAREGE